MDKIPFDQREAKNSNRILQKPRNYFPFRFECKRVLELCLKWMRTYLLFEILFQTKLIKKKEEVVATIKPARNKKKGP